MDYFPSLATVLTLSEESPSLSSFNQTILNMAWLTIPPNTVLYDIAVEGYSPSSTGVEEVLNKDALETALRLFLLASPGDYLGYPDKGGWLTQHLTKPMRLIDVIDAQTSITLALQNDFQPSLQVYSVQVIPDWVNLVWNISFTWTCPSLKTSGAFSESVVGRAA